MKEITVASVLQYYMDNSEKTWKQVSEELAERAGTKPSEPTLSRWFSGKHIPNVRNTIFLSEILGINTMALLALRSENVKMMDEQSTRLMPELAKTYFKKEMYDKQKS